MSIDDLIINLFLTRTNDVIVIGSSRPELKQVAIRVDEYRYKPEYRHLMIEADRKIRFYPEPSNLYAGLSGDVLLVGNVSKQTKTVASAMASNKQHAVFTLLNEPA